MLGPQPNGTTVWRVQVGAGTPDFFVGEFPYYRVLHGDPVKKQGMLGTIVVS